ncbi:hypothetical protein BC830DRAFT_503455 [Chytriomyces sp. MP71]|nr:hypothetical protein BC830DRAFT_503455 [Chytriomyces sp. MP71]
MAALALHTLVHAALTSGGSDSSAEQQPAAVMHLRPLHAGTPPASEEKKITLPSISEMLQGYTSPPGTPSLQPFVLASSRRTSLVSVNYQQSPVMVANSVPSSQRTASFLAVHQQGYQFPKMSQHYTLPTVVPHRPVSPLNPVRAIAQPYPTFVQSHTVHPTTTPPSEGEADEVSSQQRGDVRSGLLPRKFVCTISGCIKTFKRKHHLESHLVTHSPDKPFVCQVDGCGASYRRAQELRRHMRITMH